MYCRLLLSSPKCRSRIGELQIKKNGKRKREYKRREREKIVRESRTE